MIKKAKDQMFCWFVSPPPIRCIPLTSTDGPLPRSPSPPPFLRSFPMPAAADRFLHCPAAAAPLPCHRRRSLPPSAPAAAPLPSPDRFQCPPPPPLPCHCPRNMWIGVGGLISSFPPPPDPSSSPQKNVNRGWGLGEKN